ncbi:prune [Carabus blaptoides fortunei]
MNKFLEQTKTTLQSIGNFEKVHVVLGNESCDLDSAISSIVYGYYVFKTQTSSNTNICVIPVLNIRQDEFPLRTETKYFLLKNGINIDNLTFRNQIDLTALCSNDKLKLTLVDHHVLPVQDKPGFESQLERYSPCYGYYDTIVKLLHGTIVLDTINFNTTANRFKSLDQEMVASLEKCVKIEYTRSSICSELISARGDVSTLTPFQILHRDLKIINGMPFPGVPMLFAEFLDLSGAKESLSEFCQSKKCKVIVPMGLIARGGRVLRDVGVFSIADCDLKSAIIECLKAKEELQLSKVDTSIPGLKLFSQGNVQASRKQIVPILSEVIEKYKGQNVL